MNARILKISKIKPPLEEYLGRFRLYLALVRITKMIVNKEGIGRGKDTHLTHQVSRRLNLFRNI